MLFNLGSLLVAPAGTASTASEYSQAIELKSDNAVQIVVTAINLNGATNVGWQLQVSNNLELWTNEGTSSSLTAVATPTAQEITGISGQYVRLRYWGTGAAAIEPGPTHTLEAECRRLHSSRRPCTSSRARTFPFTRRWIVTEVDLESIPRTCRSYSPRRPLEGEIGPHRSRSGQRPGAKPSSPRRHHKNRQRLARNRARHRAGDGGRRCSSRDARCERPRRRP
jgi:hypothetical protein